jgi:hypothetical protein
MIESLAQLTAIMRSRGAHRLYAKTLAPNDNSKNQVYLGGGFSALNIIPHGPIYTDSGERSGSVRDRAKAKVDFFWVDQHGAYRAPDANLILYPEYPEVRMSGFLRGCREAPSSVMTARDFGRVLILGISDNGRVLGYAAAADTPIAKEILAGRWETLGVFAELPFAAEHANPRTLLLQALRDVYQRSWIPSQKLSSAGVKKLYSAGNGGGYTLEAELGIKPNGYSEPDFMGWEVKQYGVRDFKRFAPKSAVTLLTPEPTGGLYRDEGVAAFLKQYGYCDRNGRDDRVNFGGTYLCGAEPHSLTNLTLRLSGYDASSEMILDINGAIQLIDCNAQVAASWDFKSVMDHWNRKHAQAAYVPSLFREPPPNYRFGPRVLICEDTDFLKFLKAMSEGIVFYDPAVKMEKASSPAPVIKRRSQFRIRHAQLPVMYSRHEYVSLDDN